MGRLTKKAFTQMSASEVGKMSTKELRSVLKSARQLFDKQSKTFDKYEDTVFSPALEKMRDFYDERGKKSISRMKISQMRAEVFRLQEFFDSKSSTVPGARKIALEQDKRIFGVNSRGFTKHRLTKEQRVNFWSAYEEFKNLHNESYIRNMGSDTIQQYLGEMLLDNKKFLGDSADRTWFSYADFQELETMLEENYRTESWELNNYEYGENDILSGKRPY